MRARCSRPFLVIGLAGAVLLAAACPSGSDAPAGGGNGQRDAGSGPAAAGGSAAGGGAAGAAGGAGGSALAGPDGGGSVPAADAAGPPQSCVAIRNCVYACRNAGTASASCAEQCVSAAPAGPRAVYTAVQTCSHRECPTDEYDCRCTAECIFPGNCTSQVMDDCDRELAGMVDEFCEKECH